MNKSFVVAGGGGFIGHHLVPLLAELNRQVLVVDPFITFSTLPKSEVEPIMQHRARCLERVPGVAVERSAVSSAPWAYLGKYSHAFNYGEIDCWVHLASMPRQAEVKDHPIAATQLMITALLESLQIASRLQVRRFVFVSSSMVYGNFSEPVAEDHALNPIGNYGIFKLAGELMVKDFARTHNMEYVIVRPTAVYGPGDLPDRVIPRFFNQAIKYHDLEVHGANEVLDFSYVTDTAQGIFLAATIDKAANQTYNISNGTTHKIASAAAAIADLVGRGEVTVGRRQKNFPSRDALDISAARRDLGYCPQVDLHTGLHLQHKWLTELFLSTA